MKELVFEVSAIRSFGFFYKHYSMFCIKYDRQWWKSLRLYLTIFWMVFLL